jgi:hypothetical protein
MFQKVTDKFHNRKINSPSKSPATSPSVSGIKQPFASTAGPGQQPAETASMDGIEK